jgi:hypothetical protein
MLDGDVVIQGNPIDCCYNYLLHCDKYIAAIGWSHMDYENARNFPDWSRTPLRSSLEHHRLYGHLPYCDKSSAFHFYESLSPVDQISTQGAWRISSLRSAGLLSKWAEWPAGVRSYDVDGCKDLINQGSTIQVAPVHWGFTWNMYMKSDAVEGNWLSDKVNVGKVT